MQIFPDTSTSVDTITSSDSYSNAVAQYAETAFGNLFEQEQAMFDAASTALSDNAPPAVNTPFPGPLSLQEDSSDPLNEIQVTSEDLAALEQDLRDAGFTDDDLADIQGRIDSEAGLSWSEFNSLVNEKLQGRKTQAVDEETRQELLALFTKLGFSPQESEQLINKIRSGKGDEVLAALNEKLSSLDPKALVSVGKDELHTLVKVLGLGAGTQARLSGLLGEQPQGGYTVDVLKKALALIAQDTLKADKAVAQTVDDLRQSLREAMDRAFTREDIQKMADRHETRDVARQKVLIKEEAKENYGRAENRPDVHGRTPDGKAAALGKPDGADRAEDHTDIETVARRFREDALTGKAEQGKQADGKQGKQETDGWEAMLGKVKVADGSMSSRTVSPAAQAIENAARQAAFQERPEGSGRLTPDAAAQRMLRTVRSGLIKNLGQGTNQLTLRLDPPSLGRLSVILTVQNNDVRAVLRTDNEEAGRMLHEHMAQIREALEAQGLKVEKLDVQTQTNQERSTDWQGAEQHNLHKDWQENARRLGMARRMRVQAGEGEREMAREVQNEHEQARISDSRIDIIA